MAATAAQISYGALLGLGNGASPQVFTSVLEVVEFSGPGVSLPTVKVTNLTSPNRTEEYVAGMKDGKSVTFTCNLIQGNQSLLKNWVDAGLRTDWKVTNPGSLISRIFGATPESWEEMGYSVSGVLQVKVGMKIAGSIS